MDVLKVKFKVSRFLMDFADRTEVPGVPKQVHLHPAIGVEPGQILSMVEYLHQKVAEPVSLMVIDGSKIGIDLKMFKHWQDKGKIEIIEE